MKTALFTLVLSLVLAGNASAEVVEQSADHFLLGFTAHVEAPPAKVYIAISEVAHWWSAEHTWSGKAENLSLKTEAGGCFCERWAEGSVEHGRVILALNDRLLRLNTALGPLQEVALNGILTFKLDPSDNDTTMLEVSYRANGSSMSYLDQFAPAVDGVLAEQIDRLLRYIDTGDPQADETPAESEPPSRREARAKLIEEWSKQAAAEQKGGKSAKPKSKMAPKARKPEPPAKE
ncbi:MAG TPA: hypothetical protein VFN25_12700 [Dokdonella sp.]|uniref:hypothetical protein n=1 Tax=Dokdonella sp. TaxID=2291710 RepID=UPI002D7F63DA|nr:hypothetical protein [Dokdonella sp.]HET9033751.1 hypothetical protein [Dokdonella sp.]